MGVYLLRFTGRMDLPGRDFGFLTDSIQFSFSVLQLGSAKSSHIHKMTTTATFIVGLRTVLFETDSKGLQVIT